MPIDHEDEPPVINSAQHLPAKFSVADRLPEAAPAVATPAVASGRASPTSDVTATDSNLNMATTPEMSDGSPTESQPAAEPSTNHAEPASMETPAEATPVVAVSSAEPAEVASVPAQEPPQPAPVQPTAEPEKPVSEKPVSEKPASLTVPPPASQAVSDESSIVTPVVSSFTGRGAQTDIAPIRTDAAALSVAPSRGRSSSFDISGQNAASPSLPRASSTMSKARARAVAAAMLSISTDPEGVRVTPSNAPTIPPEEMSEYFELPPVAFLRSDSDSRSMSIKSARNSGRMRPISISTPKTPREFAGATLNGRHFTPDDVKNIITVQSVWRRRKARMNYRTIGTKRLLLVYLLTCSVSSETVAARARAL